LDLLKSPDSPRFMDPSFETIVEAVGRFCRGVIGVTGLFGVCTGSGLVSFLAGGGVAAVFTMRGGFA
jgi:hypothetical protein